jgi:DNA polymerase-3 subunit alpha
MPPHEPQRWCRRPSTTSEYRFTVGAYPAKFATAWARSRASARALSRRWWQERQQNGPFHDLFDLCQRVDLRKLNRRVLDSLIRCGAFDELGPNRATLAAQLPEALQLAEQHSRNDAAGQNDHVRTRRRC